MIEIVRVGMYNLKKTKRASKCEKAPVSINKCLWKTIATEEGLFFSFLQKGRSKGTGEVYNKNIFFKYQFRKYLYFACHKN